MLRTNDLKQRFSCPCGPEGGAPKVLLIAPLPVGKLTEFAETFEDAPCKSRKFSERYRRYAEQYGCDFLDVSEVVVSSDIDGIHLEAGERRKLGEAVAALVRKTLE